MERTQTAHASGTDDLAVAVGSHYGRPDLAEAILEAARKAGKDLDHLGPEDIAPATEFHIRGKDATLDLARLAGIRAGQRVLDVGGGLGGPARTLASEIDCAVTVLDLTEAYCRAGARLTELTGLADRVTFRHGTALDLPFPDGAFDVVWTQHSSMNVADKERLYAEAFRVIRPGGRLALHEIMAGEAAPIHFPVPWASEPAISFLRPPGAVRELIAKTGFREVSWLDVSEASRDWFRQRVAAAEAGLPPLGLHLLLGDAFGPAFRNVLRNLEERRVAVIMAVFDRP